MDDFEKDENEQANYEYIDETKAPVTAKAKQFVGSEAVVAAVPAQKSQSSAIDPIDLPDDKLVDNEDEDFAFEDEEMNPNEPEDPNRYFTKLRTKHQDLLHDFGATEVFLIEGDSLVFELLSTPTLDWSHGGQYLHIIFLLEKLLGTFRERQEPKHTFTFVFFQQQQSLWSSDPSKLLAREIIIRHLTATSKVGGFSVVQFESWMTSQWTEYLSTVNPSFVMICDRNSVDEFSKEIVYYIRSFGIHCLKNNQHVAFSSHLTPVGNKVLGYVVRGHTTLTLHPSLIKLFENCQKITNEKSINVTQDGKFSEIVKSIPENLSQDGWRTVIGLYSCLATINNRSQEISQEVSNDLVKIFLLHQVLQRHLPLTQRGQFISTKNTEESLSSSPYVKALKTFLNTFYRNAVTALGQSDKTVSLLENVADLLDGRLLYKTLFTFLKLKNSTNNNSDESILGLNETALSELESSWKFLCGASGITQPLFPLLTQKDTTQVHDNKIEEATSHTIHKLIPLHSTLIDEALNNIKFPEFGEQDPHIETIQRRNAKFTTVEPVYFDTDATKDEEEKTGWLIKKQMAFIHKYAESLEGSLGMHSKVITAIKSPETEKKEPATTDKKKVVAKKDQKAVKSKADKLKEENLARKTQEKEKSETDRWKNAKDMIDKSVDERKLEAAIESLDMFLKGCTVPTVAIEATMYKLRICFNVWKANKTAVPAKIRTFQTVHTIVSNYLSLVTKDQLKILLNVVCNLGYLDSAKLIFDDYVAESNKVKEVPKKEAANKKEKAGKKKEAPKKKAASGSKKEEAKPEPQEEEQTLEEIWEEILEDYEELVEEKDQPRTAENSATRFQMTHMGHLLTAESTGSRDDRVSFIPDDWQKDLLDAVDRNESALICAPTSSGKTFISYYCMEKVLRTSEDDVVVYVAPTKALVNQVAADVYFRFGNRRYSQAGRTVYGVYTGDYKYNHTSCQVLITVPATLETLLLSPYNESWSKKIKYAIFDEVHCIGETEGGSVWERLLQLIQCPFLALSATVGNPVEFKDWMEKIQQQKEQQKTGKAAGKELVKLILHNERYSDLQKYIYVTPAKEKIPERPPVRSLYPSKSDTYNDQSSIMPVHPLACVSYSKLEEGWPRDLTLVPNESLQLYDAMNKVAGNNAELKKRLEPLNIDVIFGNVRVLSKTKARNYEKSIKAELQEWVRKGLEKEVKEVISIVGGGYENTVIKMEDEWRTKGTDPNTAKFLSVNILHLLLSISYQDKLPAIIFNFDRHICERLVKDIVEVLERWEQGTDDADIEKKRLEKEKQKKLKAARRQRDAQERKRDLKHNENPEDDYAEDDEDEEKIDQRFSFVREGEGMDKDELKDLMRSLRSIPKSSILIRALQRGIGLHHPGLPNKYRQAVERLFRCRHIKVVIATQTLALGIHMPCRSVVFAGDSNMLNALQYRQMSGRAGRRGFDLLGHVIFYGLPLHSIKSVVAADLSLLKGHFPINSTLLLQLLTLHSRVEDKKSVLDGLIRILSNPFFLLGKEHLKEQLLFHFRYTLEFLYRNGLLDRGGEPAGLAGLMNELYTVDPEHFGFLALFKEGVFQSICDGSSNKRDEQMMNELLFVLAHIFKRRYLHPDVTKDSKVISNDQAKVILADLPPAIQKTLDEFNKETLDIFSQYVKFYSTKVLDTVAPEKRLPTSQLEFGGNLGTNKTETLVGTLLQESIPHQSRSSFAALSGVGDDYDSVDDFVKSLRDGVYLDPDALPVTSPTKRSSEDYKLNSYIVDFFQTGSLEVLRKNNGISHGDAWLLLKEFNVILQKIANALPKIARAKSDTKMNQIFKMLSEQFGRQFTKTEQ